MRVLPRAGSPRKTPLDFVDHVGARPKARHSQGGKEKVAPPLAEAQVRRAYLRDGVRLRRDCSLAWELSERYLSLSRGSRATCVPFALRQHFPAVRVLLLLDDPVRRALRQHGAWMHNQCLAPKKEKAKGKQGRRLATRTACEAMAPARQLRVELVCLRRCGLHAHSAVGELLRCAADCQKDLRASLGCSARSCPPLLLPASVYALVLPLWLGALPCEQLLLRRRDAFFSEAPTPARASAAAGVPPSAFQPAPVPPRGLAALSTLLALHPNASELARLHTARLPVETWSAAAALDPALLAELRAFLAPFEASTCTPLLPLGRHAHRPPCAQARLSQLLAKHEACVLARRTRRAAKPVKFLPRSVS
jgi:hypothetical protein